MISFVQSGDFKDTFWFLKRDRSRANRRILEKYAKDGLEALKAATPVESGITAMSWDYEIVNLQSGYKIVWKNSNIVNGIPIAVILQYGHATRNGGYVQGRDYINPALKPIFDKIAEDLWEEVKR